MKSLELIRNAGSITKTHSHSRLLGDLENCAQLWQFGQKKKKKVGNRICFGNSNAVVFWGNRISFFFEGLFSFSSSASSKILFISGMQCTEEILWSVRIPYSESSLHDQKAWILQVDIISFITNCTGFRGPAMQPQPQV